MTPIVYSMLYMLYDATFSFTIKLVFEVYWIFQNISQQASCSQVLKNKQKIIDFANPQAKVYVAKVS